MGRNLFFSLSLSAPARIVWMTPAVTQSRRDAIMGRGDHCYNYDMRNEKCRQKESRPNHSTHSAFFLEMCQPFWTKYLLSFSKRTFQKLDEKFPCPQSWQLLWKNFHCWIFFARLKSFWAFPSLCLGFSLVMDKRWRVESSCPCSLAAQTRGKCRLSSRPSYGSTA